MHEELRFCANMTTLLKDPPARFSDADPLSLRGAEVNRSKLGHIPALDGIRGLAILMVLIYHFTPQGDAVQHGITQTIARIIDMGWTGVDLFFVLSGFLITGILLRSKSSPRYFVNFYSRRALRIFPLYYFVLILVAIALHTIPALSQYDKMRSDWPYYWFYATNFLVARDGWNVPGQRWLYLGYLWSLAVEEHFYLFWPVIVRLFSRRSLIGGCLAIMAIAPILRGLSPILGQSDRASDILTQCRMDTLAIGALLAVFVQQTSSVQVLRRFGWIGLICSILFAAYVVESVRFPGFAATPFRIFGHSIVALMFAWLICLAISGNWITAAMTWRPLRFFGVYSYGIYIYHGVLMGCLMAWFTTERLSFNSGNAWIGIVPHYVLCIAPPTLIAVISYHLLEKPFLKLKRFF
jgi:peptidoglycan/LPS O-acetylase OafA/YrhL